MAKKSSSGKSGSGVNSARLHQRSGSNNSFGGYTKVNNGGGKFTMRKAGK